MIVFLSYILMKFLLYSFFKDISLIYFIDFVYFVFFIIDKIIKEKTNLLENMFSLINGFIVYLMTLCYAESNSQMMHYFALIVTVLIFYHPMRKMDITDRKFIIPFGLNIALISYSFAYVKEWPFSGVFASTLLIIATFVFFAMSILSNVIRLVSRKRKWHNIRYIKDRILDEINKQKENETKHIFLCVIGILIQFIFSVFTPGYTTILGGYIPEYLSDTGSDEFEKCYEDHMNKRKKENEKKWKRIRSKRKRK